MIYDKLDFILLKKIINGEDDTWNIAKESVTKKLYDFRDNKTKDRMIKKEYNTITNRLKKMVKENIVKVRKNGKGKNEFIVLKDNVRLVRLKFFDKYKNALIIRESDGRCCAFEI